jgi:hypothetical protein
MANPTYILPSNLGDILGAHHDGNFETVIAEIKAAIGKLKRGTVLCTGSGADAGKLILTAVGNEATVFGILLDPEVDTAVTFTDGSVTGSVARAGTFRGAALIVGVGVNAATITDTLRKNGGGSIDGGGTSTRSGVKLRVNYLSRGRYWTAGEEIPDEEVPPNIRKYAVTVSEDGDAADMPSRAEGNGTHVKRGMAWKRIEAAGKLELGEPTYRRKGKAFIRAGRVGA